MFDQLHQHNYNYLFQFQITIRMNVEEVRLINYLDCNLLYFNQIQRTSFDEQDVATFILRFIRMFFSSSVKMDSFFIPTAKYFSNRHRVKTTQRFSLTWIRIES